MAPRPSWPRARPRDIFIWGTIGLNGYVFTRWVASAPNPRLDQDASRRRSAREARRYLYENYTLSLRNLQEGRYWTLVTSAFSHASLGHLLGNMITFYAVSSLGFQIGLGAARMTWLALGSTLAASAGSMLDETTRAGPQGVLGHHHLGASGMVQGIMVATALMRPHVPFMIMFIPFPIDLWVLAVGYIAWDYYHLTDERRTGPKPSWTGNYVGYAAHLGGGAFGAAYYFLRLRYRFGGVLAPGVGGRRHR